METLDNILAATDNAKTKLFKKGTTIQKAGSTKPFAYYVTKGLLKSYIIDSNGKEHIYMFASENWIIGDLEAMEYNQSVELYIDCMEETEVIIFDKDCFFETKLSKEQIIHNTQLLYRRIGRLQRRVLMLMGTPAIDRYKYFLKTYPELIHRVPQHMIASFLGIAPQTLSTLKGKIIRSKD
ncbi:cAMP-binding domain of CRP or a regulatory subunit of cAMP-dependent protein kinases [Tenacibaculum sp. MAR_2009_124]|uniref:Crp/Fnr family transcriptional regulator n=1 Tax=Tenacibaculum sp. MAR_2009_124 TaxID=1250059 RepID=UPI000897977A|nr:Crp/Fnr family transcriptional regulator [Tenacibaculum sp. MAR_2009_124]SEC79085.1 cAMP-binding domain of CRP or a regulatory subunit of cAMP-dependent protein kinases [Tenacibaculum sp. MAR_2009_124]